MTFNFYVFYTICENYSTITGGLLRVTHLCAVILLLFSCYSPVILLLFSCYSTRLSLQCGIAHNFPLSDANDFKLGNTQDITWREGMLSENLVEIGHCDATWRHMPVFASIFAGFCLSRSGQNVKNGSIIDSIPSKRGQMMWKCPNFIIGWIWSGDNGRAFQPMKSHKNRWFLLTSAKNMQT